MIKLIHRETGSTAHELIKRLRNGWRAFIYQTTAKMFDINLKTEFNPTEVEEDTMIEGILLRAQNDGSLDALIKKAKKLACTNKSIVYLQSAKKAVDHIK